MPLYAKVPGPVKLVTVGDGPTITEGIATDFTSANYLKTNQVFSPGSSPFEIVVRASCTDNTVRQNVLSYTSGNSAIQLGVIHSSGVQKVYLYLYSSDGTTICSNRASERTIELYKFYYYRLTFNGTSYDVDLSEDKVTWNNYITVNSSKQIRQVSTLTFGWNGGSAAEYLRGSIDLNESYIKIGNNMWYGIGMSRVKVRSGLSKYSVVGSPTIDGGVVSNLSVDNYIALRDRIPFASADNWEMQLVIKLDNTNYGGKKIFDFRDYANHGLVSEFGTYPNRICFGVNGVFYETNTDLSLFVANKILYIKYIFTGTEYIMLISYDKVNWTELIRYQSSNKSTNSDILQGIGCSPIYGGPIPGSIFLNDCYIKLNGEYYWKGYTGVTDNFKLHTDNFSKYYTIVNGKLTWANPNIYLESTGTQYIDTGYKYTSGDNIKLCVSPLENGVDLAVYGVYPGGTNELAYYDSRFRGNLSGVAGEFGPKYTVGKRYKFDCINGYWSLEGTIFGNQQLSSNTTYTSYLFARNYSNDKKLSKSRVYYYKVIRNEESVQHFVPVPKGLLIGNFIVPSNGMWDIVTQTFYGNVGTGEFEIGGIPDDYIIEGGKMIWCNPDISLENNSNWSAYINTGIIPTNNMRLLVTAQLTDTTHTYDGNLLGSRKTAGTSEFCLWHNTNPGQGGFVYNSIWNTDTSSFGRDDIAGNKNEFKYDGSDFTINGVTARTRIGDITNFTSTYPIYVYALNINNTSVDNRRFRGKIYEVVFWSGSTILQYLVPVPKGILIGDKIAPSNCMFDLVTQTFFENQGTGSFTIGGISGDYIFVGDDVVWCNNNIYLANEQTFNYIDTGYTSDLNGYSYEADIQFTGTGRRQLMGFSGDYNDYWGYRNATTFELGAAQYINKDDANTRVLAKYTWTYDDTVTPYSNSPKLKVNSTEVQDYKQAQAVTNCVTRKRTFKLFNIYSYSGGGYQCNAKLFSHRIYNNISKLLQYLIPVTTNMQISGTTIPAPGMWDMVTKKYFPNKGTGSFTYGKDS